MKALVVTLALLSFIGTSTIQMIAAAHADDATGAGAPLAKTTKKPKSKTSAGSSTKPIPTAEPQRSSY